MIYRGIISAISSFRGSVNKGRAREHLFAFKLLLKVNKVIVCLTTLLELWFTPACFNLAHRFLQRHEVLGSPLVISEINRIQLTQNSTDTEFDWYRTRLVQNSAALFTPNRYLWDYINCECPSPFRVI